MSNRVSILSVVLDNSFHIRLLTEYINLIFEQNPNLKEPSQEDIERLREKARAGLDSELPADTNFTLP